MSWQRKLGGTLVFTGAVLCSVYLVPTVYGAAMSRLAIAQFRAQSPANREWDSSRILAYQRSLSIKFAPPEAILRVPRVGLEVPVLEGTDDLTLNRGVGHIPGTSLPGEQGNVAIAGHRDGFFRVLKDVVPGDIIEIQRPTLNAPQTDRYVVRGFKIVSPSDTSALARTTANELTLVTCYPFHFVGAAPQRYIVEAVLIPSVQTPSGD
jgi:sortase A